MINSKSLFQDNGGASLVKIKIQAHTCKGVGSLTFTNIIIFYMFKICFLSSLGVWPYAFLNDLLSGATNTPAS